MTDPAGNVAFAWEDAKFPLDSGTNLIRQPVRIASPKLWYPAGYGAQDRYRFEAEVLINKVVVARAALKTGLRSIELRRVPDQWGKSFTFVVNGIPIFAKGANVIPFDSFPSRVTPARYRQILQAARDAQHEHGARMGRRHLRERRLLRHLRRAWPDGLAGVHVRRRHGSRRSRLSAERA